MAEYAKKTVAELQEILKTRGLPSSGKKAELIARLNENDKQTSEETAVVPEAETAPVVEPAQPATTTATEPPTEAESTSTSAPAVAPASADADGPSPVTALADQATYALNLPTSTLDNELAKRKARAERFGTGASAAATGSEAANGDAPVAEGPAAADAETSRNLERAKRFGTGQTAIGKLDEALPSEMTRGSRKRGHAQVAESHEMDDPGLKRSFASRGRGRGGRFGGGRQRGGKGPGPAGAAAKPQGVQKSGAPAYTSDRDKLAAEARKKKFSTA